MRVARPVLDTLSLWAFCALFLSIGFALTVLGPPRPARAMPEPRAPRLVASNGRRLPERGERA